MNSGWPGRLLAVAFVLLCATPAASAALLEGRVVRIADGDTLTVLERNQVQHRVRLAGIDAPERGQPFGERSRQNPAVCHLRQGCRDPLAQEGLFPWRGGQCANLVIRGSFEEA